MFMSHGPSRISFARRPISDDVFLILHDAAGRELKPVFCDANRTVDHRVAILPDDTPVVRHLKGPTFFVFGDQCIAVAQPLRTATSIRSERMLRRTLI